MDIGFLGLAGLIPMIRASLGLNRVVFSALRFGVVGAFMLALLSGCSGVSGSSSSGDNIKVLVLAAQRSIDISGHDGSEHSIIVKKSDSYATVDGSSRKLPIYFKPQKELLYVNGKSYRGTIRIISENGSLSVIDVLPIEAYLVGVINHEISSKWPIEAVKAQAIVARTYAYSRMKKNYNGSYHIEGTVSGQVYKGSGAEDAAAARAVRETAGIILAYDGKPIEAVYHSSAGGRTEAAKEIWNKDYEYLRSVKSPYDEEQPGFKWTYAITPSELKTALARIGKRGGEPESLSIEETMPSGRAKLIEIETEDSKTYTVSGEDLRRAIGQTKLKSTLFDIDSSDGKFVFTGKGYGHGVGMSQWGAKGMAEDGYTYDEILDHYYPGAYLAQAW